MKKNEFINNLKVALEGNVSSGEVVSQLSYYNDYIESEIRKGKAEEEVVDSLGDPRLIAKTTIDLAKDSGNSYVYESEPTQSNKSFKFNSWYTKFIIAIVVIVAIVIVVAIGGLIGFVLLKFAIPIIIIILFMALFRKR